MRGERKNNIWRNNRWKPAKFVERQKPIDSRSSTNPKQDKPKEKYVKTHHNQTAKN